MASQTAVLLPWCIVSLLSESPVVYLVYSQLAVPFSAQHRSGCVRHCSGTPCQQSKYFVSLCTSSRCCPATAWIWTISQNTQMYTVVKTTTDVELPGQSGPTEACLCSSPFWASHAPGGGKALCSQAPTTGPKATGPAKWPWTEFLKLYAKIKCFFL